MSGPRLETDRAVVRAGEEICVSPPTGLDLGVSGVVSSFEQRVGEGWVTLYKLVSPSWEGVEPSCHLPDEPFWATAVGLGGPVMVRIPPVPPGRYRIARQYTSVDGDARTTRLATVAVTVA